MASNYDPPIYPDHPKSIDGATGGFLNVSFITCGGYVSGEGYTNNCFKLGSEGPFATMITKRAYAASIVLESDKLWILGGIDENGYSVSSTEYIFSDGRNEWGPLMPIALDQHGLPIVLESHAMVKINQSFSILVGGYDVGNLDCSKRTWYYDGKWLDGPDLQKGRYGHSVGIIRDSVTDQVYVVTAGGYNYDHFTLTDVEILDLKENKWEAGNFL